MGTEDQVTVTEHGAAQKVPGSKLILRIGNKRALIDIGSSYVAAEDKQALPFDASLIDYLALTHGHGDHMGQSLLLAKSGFKGPVFATPCTADLVYIQNNQTVKSVFSYNNMVKGKKIPGTDRWIPFKKSEYSNDDVLNFMKLFQSQDESHRGIPYETPVKLADGIEFTFFEAGHIPGAAQILFNINHKGQKTKLLTTYDLGRTDYKLANHPVADIPIAEYPHTDFPKDIDYVVIEATYGDREHKPLEDSIRTLEQAIKDTAKNQSVLVAPAFSIMRTQVLMNFIYNLNEHGRLPKDFKIIVSSPSAVDVIKMMIDHQDCLDETARKILANKDSNMFHFDKLVYHRTFAQTRDLLANPSKYAPCAIIASSGMGDYGRVAGVLEKTISEPKNIILKTGYASPGTRMDLIERREKTIPFTDGPVEMKADVRRMGGLSGHADCKETIAHLRNIRDPAKGEQFKGIYIKHGEKDACEALRKKLIEAGYKASTVQVMKKGISYVL